MKKILPLFCMLFFTSVYGQHDEVNRAVELAKELFQIEADLNQRELDRMDYSTVANLLEQTLTTDPEHAEGHYFLGYLYSRMNSRDGRSIIHMNYDLSRKASEHFEKVNRLTPSYSGDIALIDPYSKISSEWGSLGMSYSYHQQTDSALLAFKEGRKRGGFSDFFLHYNRKVLAACAPRAILFSSGDNSTFPLWYLQTVEKYRTDVTVVDISLLHTEWYPSFLYTNDPLLFDLPQAALDTIQYIEWEAKQVSVGDFSWMVQPTVYNAYLWRGDVLFLSLIRSNLFKREICFTHNFMPNTRLNLEEYLSSFGTVDKLNPANRRVRTEKMHHKTAFDLLRLSRSVNINSLDERRLYDSFRASVVKLALTYVQMGNLKKAKKTTRLFLKYGNEKEVPYSSELMKEYVSYLEEKVK